MHTILLIEDNLEILDNLIEYLELEGYKILFAINGEKGIAIAREFIPDLIICDVKMPVMDGFSVLHQLLNNSATSVIPFIFSTSLSEKTDRKHALELGAGDYLVKPFDLEALSKMIINRLKYRNQNHIAAFQY